MTIRDRNAGFGDTPTGPALRAFSVVPSDTVPLNPIPKGIYVGTGGTVVLRGVGSDQDVTYKNLANGSYISVRAAFVRATGTTAQDMVAEA